MADQPPTPTHINRGPINRGWSKRRCRSPNNQQPKPIGSGPTTGCPSAESGQPAVDEAQRRIDRFATKHRKAFPAAVRCTEDDRQALTAFLRFPPEHRKRIRHTNMIERTFGETRRRVKVIGRLPGEASCLSLVWSVLDRASTGWRGLRYTPAITRQLTAIRHQLHRPPADQDLITHPAENVTTAA